jgi:hypothetical protein
VSIGGPPVRRPDDGGHPGRRQEVRPVRFLHTILKRGPAVERHRRAVATRRYGVGDGIEPVDVVLYGPMVYFRPQDY